VRINALAFVRNLAMVTAVLIAGCDKERCGPALQAAKLPDPSSDIRKAAESSVRVSAKNPSSVQFRGVQVWPQAAKNQFAVCGQANVFGPSSNTYALFVVIVTRDDVGVDPSHAFKTDTRVGSTVTEATKVYIDTLARCYESGGPHKVMQTAAPVPPIPSDMKAILAGPPSAESGASVSPAPAVQPQPSAAAQAAPTTSPASGTVVMRQNGNIRTAPRGETIRVEPQGRELRVFGEAPGGWLQIGDTEANGWVHSSLVQRR